MNQARLLAHEPWFGKSPRLQISTNQPLGCSGHFIWLGGGEWAQKAFKLNSLPTCVAPAAKCNSVYLQYSAIQLKRHLNALTFLVFLPFKCLLGLFGRDEAASRWGEDERHCFPHSAQTQWSTRTFKAPQTTINHHFPSLCPFPLPTKERADIVMSSCVRTAKV